MSPRSPRADPSAALGVGPERSRRADAAAFLIAAALAGGAGAARASIRVDGAGDAVRVDVVTVTLAGRTGTPVVVVKETGSSRALPIFLGPFEATAIWQTLSHEVPPRPLTQDLLKTILDASEVTFERAVITAEKGGTYFAVIHLRRGWRRLTVDGRPSDAIALALRCRGPLFVSRALMRSPASFDLAVRPRPVHAGELTLQDVTPALAGSLGLEAARGALVADVRPGRFAGKVERGDVLLAVNGRPVSGAVEALLRLQEAGTGAGATVVVLRRGARTTVTLPAAAP